MNETMRAAVFEGEGKLKIREIPLPAIQRPEDVLVKVEACSVCGTDVHIMNVPPGYPAKPGTVLGHELVGVVVETGSDVTTLKAGDRVVCNPNEYCGVCAYCRKNLPNLCENIIPLGIEADGGFAEYVVLSQRCTFRIPQKLSPQIAMFAEPLACMINGMHKLRVSPGESVLILGAGPIGLMMVQLLKASGVKPIIVSETSPVRRDFALKSGADLVIDPCSKDLIYEVTRKTGIGADYVLDMTGSLLPSAVKLVRKGGTVLVFGVNTRAVPEICQSEITQKEISIAGTWLANASFPEAIRLLESGLMPLELLVTHQFPLERLEDAIELLRNGEAIKILIDPRKKEESAE